MIINKSIHLEWVLFLVFALAATSSGIVYAQVTCDPETENCGPPICDPLDLDCDPGSPSDPLSLLQQLADQCVPGEVTLFDLIEHTQLLIQNVQSGNISAPNARIVFGKLRNCLPRPRFFRNIRRR